MTKDNTDKLTEIVVIMDKSGSMSNVWDDAIGGFNSFLEEQQALPGKCRFTYTQFDTRCNVIHDGIDIKDVKPLTKATYTPQGNTALLDAVGKTLTTTQSRITALPEGHEPDLVIVVILTDGAENSSREFSLDTVKKLISEGIAAEWEFIYLAQGLGAFQEAHFMGLDSNIPSVFVSKPMKGQASAYAGATFAVSNLRSRGTYSKSGTQSLVDDTEE